MRVIDQALLDICRRRGLLDAAGLAQAVGLAESRGGAPLGPRLVQAQLLTPTALSQLARELEQASAACASCGTSFALRQVGEGVRCPACEGSLALTPAAPVEPGEGPRRIGRYRVEAQLGRGAFGVVYRAIDEQLQRPVAIKVMLDPALTDPEALARFRLEAQVAAKLRDPGIVRVRELGTEGTRPWFAMDYCPGPTLHERLNEGPLPVDEAVRIVAELARAVGVAHEQGVLHRDLKPANVILEGASGRPLVTDFGLARDRSLLQSMTRTGDLLGTPSYMAPEQLMGRKDVDGRVDVWSLGVILFRCLTGVPPFSASNLPELCRMVLEGQAPPPSGFRPEVTPALDAVCARALAREREDRYSSCAELRQALLEATRPGAPAVARRGRDRPVLLLAGVAVLVVGVGVGAGLVLGERVGGRSSPPQAQRDPDPPAASPEPTPAVSLVPEVGALSPAPAPTAGAAEPDRTAPPKRSPGEAMAESRRLLAAARALRNDPRPDFERVRLFLADALTQASDSGAQDLIEEAALAQGWHCLRGGRYRAAYEQLVATWRRPEDMPPEASLVLGLALRGVLGAWREGPRVLEGVARADPRGKYGLVALALNAMRRRWGGGGSTPEQAEAAAREAIRLDPGFALGWTALGSSLARQRRWPEALEAWNRAESLDPQDATLFFTISMDVRRPDRFDRHEEERGPLPPEAEAALDRAQDRYLELTEGSGAWPRLRILEQRAEALLATDPARAEATLRTFLEQQPDDAGALFNCGLACASQGQSEEAARLWRLAWAFTPDSDREVLILGEPCRSLLPPEEGRDRRAVVDLLDRVPPEQVAHRRAAFAACDLNARARARAAAATGDPAEAASLRDLVLAAVTGQAWPELEPLVQRCRAELHTAPARLELARILVGRERDQDALDAIVAASQAGADPGELLQLEAAVYSRTGRQGACQDRLELIARREDAPALAAWARGRLALVRGEAEQAAGVARGLLAKDPQDRAARLLLADALLDQDPLAASRIAAELRAEEGDADLRPLLVIQLAQIKALGRMERLWIPQARDVVLSRLSGGTSSLLAICTSYLAVLNRAEEEMMGYVFSLLELAAKRQPERADVYALQARLFRLVGDEDRARAASERAQALLGTPGEARPPGGR